MSVMKIAAMIAMGHAQTTDATIVSSNEWDVTEGEFIFIFPSIVIITVNYP